MMYVPRVCRWLGASILTLTAFSPLIGQGADEGPGLAVGKAAPAFALPDHRGMQQELAKLLKQGQVALVFYRSADW